MRTHPYRDIEEAELDKLLRNPANYDQTEQYGGYQRTLDAWLVIEIRFALNTIYRGRYRHSPRIRAAILAARAALDELWKALREEGRP